MRPTISIVMPCYNRAAFLERVLRAYDGQRGAPPFEIIAVDDGSSDTTPELLKTYRPMQYRLRPLILEHNAGPANARNCGIELVQAPLIMFVGDDILPEPDFVAQHAVAHEGHPGVEWAILGKTTWPVDMPCNTLMEHIDGIGAQQFSYHYLTHGQELDFRHLYTSNISLKTSLLMRERPWFDTGFRYAAYEDVDLGYRLTQRRGLRIMYSEGPVARHYHYYTVWGFVQRQYRCGLMAATFVRKYPQLRRRWGFRNVQFYRLAANSLVLRHLLDSVSESRLAEIEQLALHLASYYEAYKPAFPALDQLYILVLEHFLSNGKIDGDLPREDAERTRKAVLMLSFQYWLRDLTLTIQTGPHLFPREIVVALLALIAQYDLPKVRQLKQVWRAAGFGSLRSLINPSL